MKNLIKNKKYIVVAIVLVISILGLLFLISRQSGNVPELPKNNEDWVRMYNNDEGYFIRTNNFYKKGNLDFPKELI